MLYAVFVVLRLQYDMYMLIVMIISSVEQTKVNNMQAPFLKSNV